MSAVNVDFDSDNVLKLQSTPHNSVLYVNTEIVDGSKSVLC